MHCALKPAAGCVQVRYKEGCMKGLFGRWCVADLFNGSSGIGAQWLLTNATRGRLLPGEKGHEQLSPRSGMHELQ